MFTVFVVQLLPGVVAFLMRCTGKACWIERRRSFLKNSGVLKYIIGQSNAIHIINMK